MLDRTLVLLLDKGVVMELDKEKKERWQFGELQFPLDIQYLPGERVLVAEQEGGRVTERNTKGEVLWEKKFEQPLMAQRLRNGNTVMANRTQILEVDRTGKEVSSYIPQDGSSIMRAVKLRNGDLALITSPQIVGAGQAQFVRIDGRGKQVATFNVAVGTSGGRVDVLPNGNVLIPIMHSDKVVEYDPTGKAVWEVNVSQPIVATRLPNGNTLVTSMKERRAVEFDRQGKEVWEYKADTRVTRALRR
jgi:outer membrane protein assembly factor BamB